MGRGTTSCREENFEGKESSTQGYCRTQSTCDIFDLAGRIFSGSYSNRSTTLEQIEHTTLPRQAWSGRRTEVRG